MPLVSFENICLTIAGQPVLDGVNLKIERGEHVVLVGSGEAAKQGILALLDGRREPESGQVMLEPGLRVASASRASVFPENVLLFEAAMAEQAELSALRQKIIKAREEGENAEARLADMEGRYKASGGLMLERRVTRALELVGFDASSFDQPVHLLTGSERHRLVLVRLLVSNADIMVLDEPTRSLDIEATEFLESFLTATKGTVLVLSSDRAFIEHFCTRLVGVESDGSLHSYPADFDKYQSMRVDRLGLDPEAQSAMPHREMEHSGKVVFQVRKLLLRPGGQDLMSGVEFAVERGERIGVIGPVGSGKSSLLKVLADVQQPEGGHIQRGFKTLVGYLDQEVHGLSTGRRVRQELSAAAEGLNDERMAAVAAALGFDDEILNAKVEDLSQAEQSLLASALLVLGEHTVLMLDEPTQHLDCEGTERLAAALRDYPGTVMVVSRDRHFLDQVAKRILSIEGRDVVDVEGRYSELRRKRAIMSDVSRQPDLGALVEDAGSMGGDEAKTKTKIKTNNKTDKPAGDTEVPAGELEARIEVLINRMADPAMAFDWEGLEVLSAEKKQLQEQLEAMKNRA